MYKFLTLLWATRDQLGITWQLLNDNRIPRWKKAIPFLSLLYILSPFNIFTFAIPIIGQIDDIVLVMLALQLFQRVSDPHIVDEYKRANMQRLEVSE